MIRETLEETGIEVGEVVYHSSQPWPGLIIQKFQLLNHNFALFNKQYVDVFERKILMFHVSHLLTNTFESSLLV